MNNKKTYNIDDKTLEKIISVAYGSAGIKDRISIYLLTKKSSEAKSILNDYRDTASQVHKLETEEMPEKILRKVQTEIKAGIKKERSFLSDFLSLFLFKPRFSFTAVVIIVAAIVMSIFVRDNRMNSKYSQQEIERASRQTKQALALVSNIFNTTKTTITDDIIPNRVAKPINESFNYVNEIFQKGENNACRNNIRNHSIVIEAL